MTSPELKRRFAALGLFVLPAMIVQAASVVIGAKGPDLARASSDTTPPVVAKDAVKAPVWSSRQLAASKYVISLKAVPVGTSPFLAEPTNHTAPDAEPTTPVPQTTVASTETPTAPKFVLQAILSSSIGKTALIDGKPYHEGDTVRGTAWSVQTVNSETRSVTLHDSELDRTITIAVDMPALKGE